MSDDEENEELPDDENERDLALNADLEDVEEDIARIKKKYPPPFVVSINAAI